MTTTEFIAFCLSIGAIVLGAWALFWLVAKLPATVPVIFKTIAQIIIVIVAALLVLGVMTGGSVLVLP